MSVANDDIYTGTVGMPIQLVLLDRGEVHDPTDAEVREITIIQPDGTVLTRTGASVTVGTTSVADGERACLQYTSIAGDLDQAGYYTVQGYIEDAEGNWPAKPIRFRVDASVRTGS